MRRSSLVAEAGRFTLAVAALGLTAAGAKAADAAAPATPDATTVSGVVVKGEVVTTAPRVVPLTTAYSESTITAEDVKNLSPMASLQTMLQNQPSVFAFETGPNGVGANIFFRAFNSGQFAETFDGVAINDIFNGGVTGQAATFNSVLFIPANIDSVVLTDGINNPAVNSYNSLGGTINFLPKRPSDDFGGSIGGSYGSFNSYTTQASLDTGDYHGLKQLIQYDHRESDGWLANTEGRNTNVYYSALYDVPNGNQLSLVAVYNLNNSHDPLEMPTSLLQQDGGFYQFPINVANEKASDAEYMVILGYNAKLAPNITFDNKIFGGGQNFIRTSYANPADVTSAYELPGQAASYDYWIYYPFGPTYNPKTTFGPKVNGVYPGNAYHFYGYTNFAIGYTPQITIDLPHNTIIAGGNITYGELHSREYWYGALDMPETPGYNDAWDEHDRRMFVSGYIQDTIKLFDDALSITPGIKYEYASTVDTDDIGFYYPYGGTDRDKESYFAPTVGLNYKLTDHLAFNFAFGQNIKFPDISAYYNQVPGTTASTPLTPPPITIKPEHVNDYELGARYQDGGFAASVDVYREDFSSIFIDSFNPTTYETNVSNGGNALYQGVEIQLSDDVKLDNLGDLNGYIHYSYNEAIYTSKFTADSLGSGLSDADTTVLPGEPVPDVPRYLITFGGVWNYQGYTLNAQTRIIGHQYITDDDTGLPDSRTIPAYIVMDASLAKTFPLKTVGMWGKSVTFTINVNNLFNKYYYAQAYTSQGVEYASPGAPRSVLGRITVAF